MMHSSTPNRQFNRTTNGNMTGASPCAKFLIATAKHHTAPLLLDHQPQQQNSSSRRGVMTTNTGGRNTATENKAPPVSNNNNNTDAAASSSSGLDSYEVHFKDGVTVKTHTLLGKGAFARVFSAVAQNSGECFALKVCENINEMTWRRLQDEVRILQMLAGHRNIVKLHAASRVENNAFLLMEKCVSHNLHDVIIAQPAMSLDEVLWVGHQLAIALEHIHARNCIHRDLKPQNILFDEDGVVKVSDFGLSTRVGDRETSRKTIAGTAIYMAPEMASHYVRVVSKDKSAILQYGTEIDTWSYGIVLYVMATAFSPYWKTNSNARKQQQQQNNNNNQQTQQSRNAGLFEAVSNTEWDWPTNFRGDPDFVDLVEGILCHNKQNRPSIEEILNHRVWRRRPEFCPDALKIKLKVATPDTIQQPTAQSGSPLSQRAANTSNTPRGQMNNNNNNNNTQGSRSANQQHQQQNTSSTVRIRMTEQLRGEIHNLEREHANNCIALVSQRSNGLACLDELFTLGLDEINNRQRLLHHENTVRNGYRTEWKSFLDRYQDAAPFSSTMMGGGTMRSKRDAKSMSVIPSSTANDTSALRSSFRQQPNCGIEEDPTGGIRFVPIVAAAPASGTRGSRNSSARRGRSISLSQYEQNVEKFIQEVSSSPETADNMVFKCLNGHEMKVFTKIPFQDGDYFYEEVSCDSCQQHFKKLGTGRRALLRCARCDFDVCADCANNSIPQTDGMKKSYCFKCNKAFPEGAKYTNHVRRCRGPSQSPAREDGTARQTMLDAAFRGSSTTNNRRSSTGSRSSLAPISFGEEPDLGSSVIAPRNRRDMDGFSSPDEPVGGMNLNTSSRNNNNNNNLSRGRSSSATSSVGGKRVSIKIPTQEDAAPQNNDDDEDDDNLSPIQRSIRDRHRSKERSLSLGGGGYNNNNNNNDQQVYQDRNSFLPQPGSIYVPPSTTAKNQNNSAVDAAQSSTKSNNDDDNNFAVPQLDYCTLLESKILDKKNTRRSRGRSQSTSRSRSRSDESMQQQQRMSNKLHRAEGDFGDQPSRVQVRNLMLQEQHQIHVPNQLTGTTTSRGRTSASRSRQRSVADLMKQNNVQGFNGPAGDSFSDNRDDVFSPKNNNNNTNTAGPFFVRFDQNGNQYFVDANENPVHFPAMAAATNQKKTTSSRSRAGVSAPSAARQGPLVRGASKPAEYVSEPSKPVRNSAGKNNNTNNNNMLMMMNNNSNTKSQQPQQQQQAFLALPRRDEHKERFVREFLAGSWIRHYAFATNDVAFLYYCLQPGRYGAFYQSKNPQTGALATSTVVVDVHSRLVLYVPTLRGDGSRSRTNNNGNNMMINNSKHYRDAHVETEYDEEARVMPLREAQQYAGAVIGGILDYVNEITRVKAEGQLPIYVPAAHIENSAAASVPANTPFVYLRRVFPDPGSSFVLFRLSNMRSQIICNASHDFDIRWQSDKASNNVGMKYYVYRDGRAQPFSMDQTGLLSRVEKVLSEQFTVRR